MEELQRIYAMQAHLTIDPSALSKIVPQSVRNARSHNSRNVLQALKAQYPHTMEETKCTV